MSATYWVTRRLGVTLSGSAELEPLLGLAVRKNDKRAHLLVSTVLGKHIPQRPGMVHGTGAGLGRRVRELLGERDAARAVVLGYAETATGLGHSVADGLALAPYLHSTRRRVPGITPAGGFEEEHSHATGHVLLPEDPTLLAGDGPLVLVDDEFSTGKTVLNTITALHGRFPRERYVVVALVDMRSADDRARLENFAAGLGARLDVVALASGEVRLPDGVIERGRELVAGLQSASPAPAEGAGAVRVDLGWPAGLPDGGRHGYTPAHRQRLEAALPHMAERIRSALQPVAARRVLVLGAEELMYAPLRLAGALESLLAAEDESDDRTEVSFSSTTRSPVLAVDDPGYAIRTRMAFPAHDAPCDGPHERYAYNVAPGADTSRRFDAIVAVVDSVGDTPALHAPGGLLSHLDAHTDRLVLAVVPSYEPSRDPSPVPGEEAPAPPSAVPRPLRGPDFSSYGADEVGWLLKDLSRVELEAPAEEREEAIQRGAAHYAESLPVEYRPNAAYQTLFRAALEASAERIARAVAVVTEIVLAERSPSPVLVSLARAGTPVGILMRRWAQYAHGLRLPHYAISIVRGRGIDGTALRWLCERHDPADVVFVDGWTGKGAIARELAAAIGDFEEFAQLDPRLAVLADPGACVDTYGTRDDFLIPSACLNSTVSGLVSRTVLRADLIGPSEFHGAKYYRELAHSDLSGTFLDTVTSRFGAAALTMAADTEALRSQDRTPTWAGWAAVERISERYGIGDVNLVKPGLGETTRVLLRRVPWRILARRGVGDDIAHVALLAEQRGVPVEEVDDLPYACVGLIRPLSEAPGGAEPPTEAPPIDRLLKSVSAESPSSESVSAESRSGKAAVT